MSEFRRFAVSRLHLPDGRVLSNQVIETMDEKVVRYYPLTEELPFTEWHPIDYYIKE